MTSMAVNLTLLVQIIHTICAYIIIERFLLRDLFYAYTQRKRQKEKLVYAVEQSEAALKASEDAKDKQWDGFKNAFQLEVPVKKNVVLSEVDSTPRVEKVSSESVEKAVDRLTPRITQRIIHD